MNDSKKGISPVIGVILLVALTVALVGLSTITVFNSSNNSDDSSSSTATLSMNDNNDVQLIRNENFEKITVEYEDGDTVTELTDTGESYNLNKEGDYNIIGISPDGSEKVIRKLTVDSGYTEISFVSEEFDLGNVTTSESSIITNVETDNTTQENVDEDISVDNITIDTLTQE